MTIKIITKDNSGLVQCTFCEKRIKERNIKGHEKRHKQFQANMRFPCEKCEKVFNSDSKLSQHFKVVHEAKQLNCTECGKVFRFASQLKYHIEAIHLKIRKYECHICSSTFTDSTPLRYHIQRHKVDPNAEAEFKCPSCDKSYNL